MASGKDSRNKASNKLKLFVKDSYSYRLGVLLYRLGAIFGLIDIRPLDERTLKNSVNPNLDDKMY